VVDLTTSEVERAGENLRRLEENAREWLAALGIHLRPDPHGATFQGGATFLRWSEQFAGGETLRFADGSTQTVRRERLDAGEIPAEWEWEGDGPLPAEAKARARKVREIHGALSYAAWVHRLGGLWGRACEAAGIARAVADAAAAAEGRPGAREYQPEALRFLVTILAESTDLLAAIVPKDVAEGLEAADKARRDRETRQESARGRKGCKADRDRALVALAERYPELSAERLRLKLKYSEADRRATGLERDEIPSTRTIQRALEKARH
jgi:hypothetical protein